MSRLIRAATFLVVAAVSGEAFAAPPEAGKAPNTLGFLEVGKDYVVRFSEGSNIFKTSQGGFTESTYTLADGQKKSGGPVAWNFTATVNVFQVVRFGGGSWVLLRHPSKPDDYLRWSSQREAMAILAGPHLDAVRARPDGEERMKKLKEAAGAKIPTAETWVNLDHAVAIADVPTEEVERKPSIQSAKTGPVQ